MNYTEITVFTTSEMSEVVAYFMSEVCMNDGISIYDKNDFDNASWDYKDEGAELVYCNEVMVKGYCNQEDTQRVLCFLREKLGTLSNAGSLNIEVNTVDGNAWVAKWHETFKPIETDKIVICPEWQSVTTNKLVLMLDTGVAFGTGQHETTSMCLAFAENMNLTGKRVLDVGCGSGILGLSALLMGADSCELVDIDSQATDATKHNAEINKLTDRAVVKTGNLTDQTTGTFDVVLANLTAPILQLLFDGIKQVVHEGTVVILSGILDVKLQEVEQLYTTYFTKVDVMEKGEWRALKLVR